MSLEKATAREVAEFSAWYAKTHRVREGPAQGSVCMYYRFLGRGPTEQSVRRLGRKDRWAHLIRKWNIRRRLAFGFVREKCDLTMAEAVDLLNHSSFSVDLSVRIPATSPRTREALAQYITRPPVSLTKMLVEEHAGSFLYRSEYNAYFKNNAKLFPAAEFLVEALQHLFDARARLVRRYGLYSSRSRGTWSRKTYLFRLAPEGWIRQHEQQPLLGSTAGDAFPPAGPPPGNHEVVSAAPLQDDPCDRRCSALPPVR